MNNYSSGTWTFVKYNYKQFFDWHLKSCDPKWNSVKKAKLLLHHYLSEPNSHMPTPSPLRFLYLNQKYLPSLKRLLAEHKSMGKAHFPMSYSVTLKQTYVLSVGLVEPSHRHLHLLERAREHIRGDILEVLTAHRDTVYLWRWSIWKNILKISNSWSQNLFSLDFILKKRCLCCGSVCLCCG